MFVKELGASGVDVAEVGLGTWDYHAGPELLREGIAQGATFIDTAPSYGTESIVGDAIKGMRARVFMATKVPAEHLRRSAFRQSVDKSLKALNIDFIDLLQLHAPNPAVPIEETLAAAGELIDAGKVRFIGVSNFSLVELQAAQKASGRHPIVSNQVRFNLVDRTIAAGLLQYCQAQQITVIAYSPLGRDMRRIYDADPAGVLRQLASATGKTVPQLALNWCLSHPGVVVIPKSNVRKHVIENCGASGWRLSAEERQLLDEKILYRLRTSFDAMIRRMLPAELRTVVLTLVNMLPQGLRRRIT